VSLAGQNIPKRPPLNGADTNQAAAYYQYGLSMLQQDPPKAADAFYVLGRVDEFAGKAADAVGDYRAYLGHTRAQDPRIADVQRRLAGLSTAAGPNR
jgi:hypothetical protein